MAGDIGDLKGEILERRYRERAPAYLARVVRRAHLLSTEELLSLLEDAVERGELSDQRNSAKLTLTHHSRR